jgi:hypothetical protein
VKQSKTEAVLRLGQRLAALGFSAAEVVELLRIERTLQRWAELECGDGNDWGSWAIERDGENGDGKPFMVHHHYQYGQGGSVTRTPVADREAGALKRLARIMAGKTGVVAYHQGDPRGCALWIVPTDKVPKGSEVGSCYTNGVAVSI